MGDEVLLYIPITEKKKYTTNKWIFINYTSITDLIQIMQVYIKKNEMPTFIKPEI